MQRTSRMRFLVVVLVAFALVVAACGGDTEDTTTTTAPDAGETTTTVPDDGGEETTTTTEGEPDDGEGDGQFVIAIRQVGEVFDPTSVLPSEISAVAGNVYDWLWDRNPDGSIKPGIVEEWSYSEDFLTLELQLRDDVTFHTGEPMTADDVVFSWNRLVENGFSSRVARTLTNLEVVDDHTLVLTFQAPEVGFTAVGGFPVVSEDYHAEVGEEEFLANPVGTGPYSFADFQPGEYVDLVANPDYWGESTGPENVRMRFITDDETRVSALEAGEVDMIMQTPFQVADTVEGTDGLTTVELRPGGFSVFVAPKYLTEDTPWSDPLVREALAIAIDREAIVNDILEGIPESYPFLAPSDIGYDPSLEHYPYDPDRAQELLAEAGYPDGFEVQLPYIAGAVTGLKETAEAVALYWNQIGVQAAPIPLEGPQFVGFALGASEDPEQDYLAVFIGALAGRPESSIGLVTQFSSVTPFTWYRNDAVNGLVLRASATPIEEARADVIRQAGQLIKADHGFIPLWTAVHVYGLQDCIEFTPTLGDVDLMLLRDVDASSC